MTYSFLPRIFFYGALGALLALAYFYALRWNVRLYVTRGAAWSILSIHLMRLLSLAAALTLFAREGALPLLSCVAGFLMMRTVAINRQLRVLETSYE